MLGYIFCDGGARGNPGPAGAGTIIYNEEGKVLAEDKKYLGKATNNVAEYQGVLLGLKLAKKQGITRVHLRLDSELIVNQLTGRYKVRDLKLRQLWQEVKHELAAFDSWQAKHIPRAENSQADFLVNQAIDKAEG